MTDSNRDVEELKRLQEDAAKQRAKRKRRRSSEAPVAGETSGKAEDGCETEAQAVPDAAGHEQVPESKQDAQHFADQLANAVKKLEDVAREHPSLVLLAAFSTGIVVGSMFSRR